MILRNKNFLGGMMNKRDNKMFNYFIVLIVTFFVCNVSIVVYAKPYKISKDDQQVGDYEVSTNSSYVVYRSSRTGLDEYFDLYSAKSKGGKVTQLNTPFETDKLSVENYLLSQNSSRVVYLVKKDESVSGYDSAVYELYSVPIWGGQATKLYTSPSTRMKTIFQISPNGTTVVFVAQTNEGKKELYSIPIDGGEATQLFDDLGSMYKFWFKISPDSQRLVFKVDEAKVYSVPLKGAPATKLFDYSEEFKIDGVVPGGNFVLDINQDSSMVVYSVAIYTKIPGGQSANLSLKVIPIDGGDSKVLDEKVFYPPPEDDSPPFCSASLKIDMELAISRDSKMVACGYLMACEEVGSSSVVRDSEVFSKPIHGGELTSLYSGTHGYFVKNLSISPDSKRVVFVGSLLERDENSDEYWVDHKLISTPITGSFLEVLSTNESGEDTAIDPTISKNSQRVVYKDSDKAKNAIDLYSIPIEGGVAKPLYDFNDDCSDPHGGSCGVSGYRISNDSQKVFYRANDGNNYELKFSPINGGVPVKVDNDVDSFLLTEDANIVVYKKNGTQLFGDVVKETIPLPSKVPPVGIYMLLEDKVE